MQDNTQEWDLYVKGRDYNNKLNPPYYSTIDKNLRFYGTDHWRGVKANGLPTPIFPITKQIVDYKISSIVSSRTKMQFSVKNIADETEDPEEKQLQDIADVISGYSQSKWEDMKMDSLIREVLLKGATSGDMCFYTYWDSTIDSYSPNGIDATTQKPVNVMGDFVTEVVDGGNVMFGNPNDRRVQKQPYILIIGRDIVENLKKKAKLNKIPQTEIDKIAGDVDYEEQPGDRGKIELDASNVSDKCLYFIKLWKDNNKVMMRISTKAATIQKDTDTGLTLYPIAWANWDLIENSYHGQAEVTGIVPNQILINKLATNIAVYMQNTAFGKVIYDRTKIAAWDNRICGAVGVQGSPNDTVQQIQPGQMNAMVMNFFDSVIKYTKDIAGANDSALGNVDPKNTSAIVALQKQSAIPLEAVKDRLYQLIEDLGYVWLDFMINKYEVDRKVSYQQNDKTQVSTFNGSQYKNVPFKLKIDVGPSSYWSEITAQQSLDNLLNANRITFIQYLERMPNGVIPKVQELIDEINQQNQQMEQQQMAQQQQAQQQSMQSQQMAQQTQQLQQAHKQLTYAQMEQFVKSLAPQVQEELRKLPDSQYEAAVQQLMQAQQQGQLNPQNQ